MTTLKTTAGDIIAESDSLTLIELVEQNKTNLSRADLSGANLKHADLRRASLRDADLSRACLYGADLEHADLEHADLEHADLRRASLRDADLSRACLYKADLLDANLGRADLCWANFYGANLRGADLSRANLYWANLRDADLTGAKGFFQTEEGLLEQVIERVLGDKESLGMSDWHTCDTVHCIAGWACYLAKNKELEKKFGPAIAAQMLLGLSNNEVFYFSNEEALEWLNSKRQN